MRNRLFAFLLTGVLASCTFLPAPQGVPSPTDGAQIANPASVYCGEQGGSLTMSTRGELGQYGVCVFPDGKRCEEWAMMRGECPAGGVDVSAFAAEQDIFCLITGGEVEPGDDGLTVCRFRNGRLCDTMEYFEGKCWKDATGVQ